MKKSKHVLFIITPLLFIVLVIFSILLWNTNILSSFSFAHELSQITLRDKITIQIQSIGLTIGIIAAIIALANFWRKSGLKFKIEYQADYLNYFLIITNLKDKEISILNFYIYLTIDNKEYLIDTLQSAKNDIKSNVTIKAYGSEHIKLKFPIAINVLDFEYLENPQLDQPEIKYIYISPLIKKNQFDLPQYCNIILSSLRAKKKLRYMINTNHGSKRGYAIPMTFTYTTNHLIFCDKKDLIEDYNHQSYMESLKHGRDYKKPKSITDEQLDMHIKFLESSDDTIKKNKGI